ncbi:DUF2158 domain-containing protein [Aeromonas jandaei]|uniref:DUF2158 domain-containing protein n=1 Tax=Aeromonas jandaei TaxID=650 RepID=UPI00059DF6E6|nr:DUF2158 domain-containing protein [Aeromonas jandaei]
MNGILSGSVVRLRSGGPYMTVNNIVGQKCECVWFVNDELRSGAFFKSSLFNKKDIDASSAEKKVTKSSAKTE